MLEYFPDPYPDELLYSVWARFSERVRYLNRIEVLLELFGKKRGGSATIEWSCSLAHLIEQLPPGHCYTAEKLINQNTLFPFYAPFQPPERARALRRQMVEGDGRAMYMRMGILTSHLLDYPCLRYCPVCLEGDRERFGEAYWHRLHQASGVEICHVHGVFLEDSNLSRSAARVRFTSAEEAAYSVPPRSAVTVPYYSLLKDIAESISELLSTCFPSSGADFIREQYFALLNHRGFITTSGHMRVVEFLKAFTDYYSPSLLSLLHCELSHTHSIVAEWAARLPYLRKTQHPLHHLLIIRFLGARISAFLSQPISPPRPFGEGPWPCLNPVCRHYRHPYISSYQVRPKSRAGKPAAVFACTCGFTYSRVGPDRLPQDVFRRDKISSYGFLWQGKLREMWLDPHNSVESIARHLGVDFSIVKQQARKLGLPARNILRKDSKLNAGRDEDPLQYRNAWLKIVEENQGERLAALLRRVTQARTVYNWLNEHDREWLLSQRQERKMPRLMKTHLLVKGRSSEEPPNKQRKDWRDKLTSEAVTEAGERIMHTPGEPQRTTRAQIERAVPEVAWLLLRPNDFPLTVRAFDATRESREAFALRRIRWALQDCKEGNIKPTRREFILRAKARRVLNIPAVQTAIEEALRILYS